MSTANDFQIVLKEIRKKCSDNAVTVISAIQGDPSAWTQIVKLLADGIISIPDTLFYTKLNQFLNGSILSENDRSKMRAFLASYGSTEENCMRIMNCINTAESNKKIELICNATRCALNDEIDLLLFFRICNAVNMLMEDDMSFLAEHIHFIENIEDNRFGANYRTHALFSVGAMKIITTVKGNGDYAFTPFARILDATTISFPDDKRYPNRKAVIAKCMEEL